MAAAVTCCQALSICGMVAGWCNVCQSESPLCDHKLQGRTATLSVIDFRSPTEVPPSAQAHDMGMSCWSMCELWHLVACACPETMRFLKPRAGAGVQHTPPLVAPAHRQHARDLPAHLACCQPAVRLGSQVGPNHTNSILLPGWAER